MNLLLTLALSAVLVAPVRPTTVEPDSGSVAFTTATVWLRVAPTFYSKRVVRLPRGTQVQVIGCRKQTCNVEYQRLHGYVRQELLRTTPTKNSLDPGRGYLNAEGELIPTLSLEDALTVLMSEHHFSVPIQIVDVSDQNQRNIIPAGYSPADLR